LDDFLVLGFSDSDAGSRIREAVERGGSTYHQMHIQLVEWRGAGSSHVEMFGPHTYESGELRGGTLVAGTRSGWIGDMKNELRRSFSVGTEDDVARMIRELELDEVLSPFEDLPVNVHTAIVVPVPRERLGQVSVGLRQMLENAGIGAPASWSGITLPEPPADVLLKVGQIVETAQAKSFELSNEAQPWVTLDPAGSPPGMSGHRISMETLLGDVLGEEVATPPIPLLPFAVGDGGAAPEDGASGAPLQATRYVEGRAPMVLAQREPSWLLVQITSVPPENVEDAATVEFPVGESRVHAMLCTSPDLRVTSVRNIDIVVPRESDTGWHGWEVCAQKSGMHEAIACLFCGGEMIGAVPFTLRADATGVARMTTVSARAIDLSPLQTQQGLLIVTREADVLRFVAIDGANPHAGVEAVEHRTIDPAKVTRSVSALDEISRGEEQTMQEDRAQVLSIGRDLYSTLLPESIQRFLSNADQRWKSLKIVTDEDDVPWELLADENGTAPFIASRIPILRWRAGATLPAPALSLTNPALIAGWPIEHDQSPTDAGAAMEAMNPQRQEIELVSHLITHAKVPIIESDAQLREALSGSEVGVIHYAGHIGTHGKAHFSSMYLRNAWFSAANVSTVRPDPFDGAPLVFLNACASDREAADVGGIGSWSKEFIGKGAGAFVGTNWSVRVEVARSFATHFYEALVDTTVHDLARVTQIAREKTAHEFDDWVPLAYAVYGHPTATRTTGDANVPT
jgi:hypothetical protein